MKTLLASALLVLFAVTPALAQNRHHRQNGYNHHRHHNHHNHHRHRHNYGGYALGALGLAIIGSVIYDQYGRRCYREVIGYNSWGEPITRRVCE